MKSWMQPPRLRVGIDDTEPRHATWLELFYDLVFVVTVSQLAHNLSDDVSWRGFVGFVVLFVPVWWAWIGATFYANRFDTDTIGRRVLMAAQMLAIAALAVNVHHGLGETASGFALAYAAARAVLVLEYIWAALTIPIASGLAKHYAAGFAIAAILWFISAFVPAPLRFVLWGIGLLIDFATPLTAVQHQRQLLPHTEHLPERFGLFVIIVLGEAVIAVVNGVSEVDWNIMNASSAVCGFIVAFSLWWVYFENVGSTALRAAAESGRLVLFQVWFYVHLPLVIGMAAAGVGVEHVVVAEDMLPLSTPERWLMCGSLALCFTTLAVLHRTGVIFKCRARTRHRLGEVAVCLVVAIAGSGLTPLAVIGILAITSVVQVGLDLYQGHPAAIA